MRFSKQILDKAAESGSAQASESFSKLAGVEASVNVSSVVTAVSGDVENIIMSTESKSVVVYAQMISGVNGVSMMLISREEALAFVDLLNDKPLGTTGVLMDIDRSAIKETLNILSNSFINALAKHAKEKLMVGDPRLLTIGNLQSVIKDFDKDAASEEVIVFKTELEISQHKIKAKLFMVFSDKIVEIIK